MVAVFGAHAAAQALVAARVSAIGPLPGVPQPLNITAYECLTTVEGLEQKMIDGLWLGLITKSGREPTGAPYQRHAVTTEHFEVVVDADRVTIKNRDALEFYLPPLHPAVAVGLFDSESDGDLVATISLDHIQYLKSAVHAFDAQKIRIERWQTWFTLLKMPDEAPVKSVEVAEQRPVLDFDPEAVAASDAWI